MKNLFIYTILLCLSLTQLKAQQGVVFKIKYLPNRNYAGTVNMDMNCQVMLSGNDTVISKLKSQGMTQPIALIVGMKMEGNTKSGPVGANNTFPLVMQYKFDDMNVSVNGKPTPMPTDKLKGISLYAHVGADGKLKADSIGGQKVPDTAQVKVEQLMNAVQKNIKFPDHPMKIGETFVQDMPFNLPVGGNKMDLNAKTTYKLISITDGNANFDVQQNMDMTIPIAGATITLVGTGTGKMVYSIKDNFATDYSANITLKVNGKIKTLLIDATAAINMDYKYVIN